MRQLSIIVLLLLLLIPAVSHAQEDSSPMMIQINRILLTTGSKYSFYIPTFEFHMIFQKEFDNIRSTVSADYDYQRQDMGFGMTHSFFKYTVNPGISVDDNLYFREVFSDSTGIWRRKQSVSPFLIHSLSNNSSIGMTFKVEREWSPRRRMGTKIVSNQDRSFRLHYLYQNENEENVNSILFYAAVERSYRVLGGEFNYFLLDFLTRFSHRLSPGLRYRTLLHYRGNMTPQLSPIFFLGGRSNLIGYSNDELWGRKVFNWQNLLEMSPFPNFVLRIKKAEFRKFSILTEIDLGRVKGAENMREYKTQTDDLKLGFGGGLGFTTDMPYMSATVFHFLVSTPSDDIGSPKFYAGFGGWMD